MRDRPLLSRRLDGLGTTIFAKMSALAVATGASNLGQGFPDTDGPVEVLDAAVGAIRSGQNQYPPGRGIADLRAAVAEHQQAWYGLGYDPDGEVLITAGATEAIAAAILALCEMGDEVIVLEPTYDSYAASIALAGARAVPVRLEFPDYRLDVDRLRAAITDRTRLLLINSPHNPTGRVLTGDELAAIAAIAVERDLLVLCDEVYEHLTFDDHRHLPLATFPGMRERTLQVSSAGKTFSATGWKIGWVCSTPELITAVTTTKQFLTYVNGAPFQPAVAVGLRLPPERFAGIRRHLQAGRDLLVAGLARSGLRLAPTEATYFVTADISPLGEADGYAFCRTLPQRCGVVAVPAQVFYADPDADARRIVRFAFCKRPEVLAEAAQRLARLAG